MATDDVQRLVVGSAATPAGFTIPGNGQMRPKAVFASFDGSGAGGSYVPALKITSDAGKTVGIYPLETTVAAGASVDVSWFRGLGRTPSVEIPGVLLGTRAVQGPANTYTVTSTTGLVGIGLGTLGGLTFSVPESGQVYVRLDLTMQNTSNVNNSLGLVDGGGTPVMGPFFCGNPNSGVSGIGDMRVSVVGAVPGLTPGQVLTWFAAGQVSAISTMNVRVNTISPINYELYTAPEL